SDDYLAMAKQNEINICECRYALDKNSQEMKDKSNNIPNIHEIDEVESETEEMTALDQPDSYASDEEGDKVAQKIKDTSDDESVYIGESFYSDESYDESEVTNVTSESLNTSSLIHITDLQLSQSSKEQNIEVSESSWKDNCLDESYLFSDELSRAATANRDRFTKSRKYRRWNMSFTDEEMRKIEWENELLLRKIMAQQKPRHKILGEGTVQSRTSSSAINRKKLQKKIENDNVKNTTGKIVRFHEYIENGL
ncbi:hypothetical protein ALC62_01342, partial [Cyphomyrmex costatus]